MKFGLEVQVIENIISVLEQHPKVDKAFVFGSRAKGNYRPDSDIDIAIKANEITTDDIIALSVAIETKGITHKFDLLAYNSIKEPALKEHIDRVGIEFYSRWRETKLNDICKSIISGGTPLTSIKEYYENGTIAWIKTKEVLNNKIYDSEFKITELGLQNSSAKLLPINSITIAMYGDGGTAGRVAINKIPLATNQACGNLIVNAEIADFQFVFYYLLNSYEELVYLKSGSGQQNLNLKTLKDFTIELPPLNEQITIASILSSLDDKIELLNHQNKTFEQLAETLFRQWFVEDAKIDIVPLKKYVEVIDNRGKTPPFSDIKTDYPIVEVKSLSNSDRFVNYDACEKYVNEEIYNNWFRKGHPIINDILISTVGSIGEMAYVIENKGGIAQNVVGLRPHNISPFYIYQYLSLPKTRREIKDLDIGAVQPSIKVPHLLDLEIPIPKDIKLVMEFEMQLIPIFEKMKVNHFQIKTLTQTRDTLLPKLMSGELRVEI